MTECPASVRYSLASCGMGRLLLAAGGRGVCAIALGDDDASLCRWLSERFPGGELHESQRDCRAWLKQTLAFLERPAGGLKLPLEMQGTAFQRQVWKALMRIPCGRTTTYAQLAQKIGRPTAVRAVASACAANRIALAIPCHRVIRSDGSLGGYRWGVDRKRELLARESQSGGKKTKSNDR